MKTFYLIILLLSLIFNLNISYAQSNSTEITIPNDDSYIIKLLNVDSNIYICKKKAIFSLNIYSDEIKSLNIPYLSEDEYIQNLIFGNQGIGYLLTSKNLYETSNDLTKIKKILIPSKIDINQIRKFEYEDEDYFYEILLKNDELILTVAINRYNSIVFVYDDKLNKWEPLEYDFIDLDKLLNKNNGFSINSELVNQTQIDSIFVFHNFYKNKFFLKKFEIPNSFESEVTSNRSSLYFYNEKVGLYYNINNQYLYLTATRELPRSTKNSSINLYSTIDGGKSWFSNNLLQYNDIHYIKFFGEKDGYLICSKINKEGEYIDNYEKTILHLFDDAFGPKDFVYNILKTTDGGISWNKTNFQFNSFEPCDMKIQKNDDNSFCVLIKNELYKSTDGSNWVYVASNIENSNYDLNLCSVNSLICYLYNDNKLWKISTQQEFHYGDSLTSDIHINSIQNNYNFSAEYQNNFILKESSKYKNERDSAFILYNEGNYLEAIPILTNLIDKDLYFKSQYLLKLGYSYLELNNYSEAIRYFEESYNLDSNATIANNLGYAYQEIGNYDKALDFYKKAVELNPESEIYKNNLNYISDLTYKLTNDDTYYLNKYFPIHKVGSKKLYWQNNNSAYYSETIFNNNTEVEYGNISINYFYNYLSYQINDRILIEEGKYKIIGNSLAYFGFNNMLGDYSYKIISFPIHKNIIWSAFGFQLKVLSLNESIVTTLGRFDNCLMLGNDFYREYYAPEIGLILVVSKIETIEFNKEKELIEYNILK